MWNAGKMEVPADSVKPPSFASLLLWKSASVVLVLFLDKWIELLLKFYLK